MCFIYVSRSLHTITLFSSLLFFFSLSISVHLSITIATCVVLARRVVVSHHCLPFIQILFTHYPTAS